MMFSAKGLLLAGVQVMLVLGTGAKLLYDRATLPQVWVKAGPFDPNLPIRGRYVRLALELDNPERLTGPVSLSVDGDRLAAHSSGEETGNFLQGGRLFDPVAFFIPEHIPDPSRRANGEELWVDVTVPGKGPPRPVRLGVKKNGVITPLNLN